jgi:hypothetical protein
MKIKNNITEKKLTKSELEVREKVIKDLKKNKSSLVKRYGKDAEAVMYGRATNIAKKMAESENKNRIKELVKKSLMSEIEVPQDKDHKITQEGNLWVLIYKNKNKTFKQHFSSKKEAEEFWNSNKNSNNFMKFEEGKKEDVTGDGKIDSKDYLAKRDIAIQKAKSKVKNESLEGIKTSEDLDKLKSYLKELTDEGIIHREVYNNILSLVKQTITSTKSQPEDLNEDIDLGHEDNEPHMIKGELYRIGKYAMELYAMAEELEETGQEIDFPAWWQAMITDAASKMVKAKHYLDFELKEPAIDAAVDALTGEAPHMGEPDHSDLTEGFLDRIKASVKEAVASVDQDTTTSSVKENVFLGKNLNSMGSSYSDYSSDSDINIDILASKIAKALKNPENQNEDDQNNIKQARKALNLGDIEIAGKIIKPYITEKIAKQLKEYTKDNFQATVPGSGRPKIDPALFSKLMPKSAKTSKEAEDRIKMYNGSTMFVHVQYFDVTPNGNMPNKPIYRLYQQQYYNNDYNAPANLKGESVNVTFLTIFDITNEEVELGVCYVDTKVFLDEYKVVFELLKNVSEDIRQNSPGELDGEYEGKPQKIQGADIYDTLKDILDISNSENDFIRKITDSLTDETSSLSKSTEEKLRNWYKKNVTN